METRYLEFGPFRLDSKSKVVLRHGKAVPLNLQAIEVLITLVGRRGAVVGTDELLRSVSRETPVDQTNLIQNIAVLRHFLAEASETSSYIEELPSNGYRFVGPVRDIAVDTAAGDFLVVGRPVERHRGRQARWGIATATVSVLAVAVLWVISRHNNITQPLTPVPLTSYQGAVGFPTFSPEGDRVAFNWNGEKEDNFDIYVKLVGPDPPLRLTTDPGIDFTPVWSPDGRSIAFQRFHNGILDILVVPALGGAERKIGQLYSARYDGDAASRQLSWSRDGKFLVASGKADPAEPTSLFTFAVADGKSAKITSPPPSNLGDFGPAFSPDGLFLAFCRVTAVGVAELYVGRIGPDMQFDSLPKPITSDRREAASPVWTPDGKDILFVSTRMGPRTTLWRIPASPLSVDTEPARVDFAGERVLHPAISSAAHRLAFMHYNFDTNIWRIPIGADGLTMGAPAIVLSSPRNEFNPSYSPDGSRISFISDRTGSMEVWISDSAGGNLMQLTNFSGAVPGAPVWSPDGRKILFDARLEGKSRIYLMDAAGGKNDCLTSGQSSDLVPSWSRDGKFIYYASNRNGDMQVWKMRADGSDAKQITTQGGYFALESPDGKTLYYSKYPRRIAIMNTPFWKVPANGGEEKLVLENGPAFSRNFAIAEKGIYLVPTSRAMGRSSVQFFRFSDKSLHDIARLPHRAEKGFSLAPDGKSLLYTQVDHQESEVMLVDNFR